MANVAEHAQMQLKRLYEMFRENHDRLSRLHNEVRCLASSVGIIQSWLVQEIGEKEFGLFVASHKKKQASRFKENRNDN